MEKQLDDALMALMALGHKVQHRPTNELSTSTAVYYVEEGLVRSYQRDYRCTNLAIHVPGDFIGLESVFDVHDPEVITSPITHSTLIAFPHRVIIDQVYDQPYVGTLLLRVHSQELNRVKQSLLRVKTLKTRQRLASAILELASRTGIRSGGFVEMPRITHQIWADEIGTSREIITATLNEMARANCIMISGRRRSPIRVNVQASLDWIADLDARGSESRAAEFRPLPPTTQPSLQ